jgi:hypothetical protein
MGAAYMPEFVDIYLRLGRAYGVPILLVKDIENLPFSSIFVRPVAD